jgi:DNA-binding transcriptional ArsR family regulator
VNQLGPIFSALADPTRREVVALLSRRPRAATEIATRCRMSGPAMSRHLRVLRRSGLVEVIESRPEADARIRRYRLRPEPFFTLKEWADHMQSFWDGQLAAFKRYAEGKRK